MLSKMLVVASLALSLGGCCPERLQRPVRFVPIGAPLSPHPRPVETVTVFTVRPPDRPFTEAGVLVAEQEQALRWGAAQLGCNAIFMLAPITKVSSHRELFTNRVSVDSQTTH